MKKNKNHSIALKKEKLAKRRGNPIIGGQANKRNMSLLPKEEKPHPLDTVFNIKKKNND